MLRDPKALGSTGNLETELGLEAKFRIGEEGHQDVSLVPEDHNPEHTFSIRGFD